MYEYKVAVTEEEKQKVLSLIKSTYKKRGYFSDVGHDESFGKYLLLPNTKMFTAGINGELFGTVSVVNDSDVGLPMDYLNKNELQSLRSQGYKLAEVTQYAIDHDIIKKNDSTFNPLKQYMASLPMLNLVFHYALYLECDYLVIATTPEHAMFYTTLGFEVISEKKFYSSVNTWGIAQALSVKKIKENKNKSGILDKILEEVPDYSLFK